MQENKRLLKYHLFVSDSWVSSIDISIVASTSYIKLFAWYHNLDVHSQFKFNITVTVALISPLLSYTHTQYTSLSLFFNLLAEVENLEVIPYLFPQCEKSNPLVSSLNISVIPLWISTINSDEIVIFLWIIINVSRQLYNYSNFYYSSNYIFFNN